MTILALLAVLGIFVSYWFGAFHHDSFGYTNDAEYYCEELDMTLSFSTLQCTVTYGGTLKELHIFQEVRLIMGNDSESTTAMFRWDKANDVLVLEFDQAPEEIDCSKKYYFHRINK